jgi:hypothetical protein
MSSDAAFLPDLSVPALSDHVVHVFKVRSEKQMLGIHARTNIAAMTDKQAIGDWAVKHQPRRPVGSKQLSSD